MGHPDYEFTRMPFGLSNAGSNFCCLMEQCLSDQQVAISLLYLDDSCFFATAIDAITDCREKVYKWLKEFYLKIIHQNSDNSLLTVWSFEVMYYQPKGYLPIPKK